MKNEGYWFYREAAMCTVLFRLNLIRHDELSQIQDSFFRMSMRSVYENKIYGNK